MEILTEIPAVLYMFLNSIATIGLLPMSALTDGFTKEITNPFNTNTWKMTFDGMNGLLGDIFDWVFNTLHVPADMPIFATLLFVTAITFFVVFLVRFVTGIIQ